jgi:hypothetical protein
MKKQYLINIGDMLTKVAGGLFAGATVYLYFKSEVLQGLGLGITLVGTFILGTLFFSIGYVLQDKFK